MYIQRGAITEKSYRPSKTIFWGEGGGGAEKFSIPPLPAKVSLINPVLGYIQQDYRFAMS